MISVRTTVSEIIMSDQQLEQEKSLVRQSFFFFKFKAKANVK